MAGPCEVLQLCNRKGLFVDVAVGMRTDDDAKLIYIGKKHIYFSNNDTDRRIERETIELSSAFEGFLKSVDLIDKYKLEVYLRTSKFERIRELEREKSKSK